MRKVGIAMILDLKAYILRTYAKVNVEGGNKMALMTKELESILKEHPLGKHDGENVEDVKIICKYFVASELARSRYTFYVTEGSKIDEENWEFYGWCKSPLDPNFDELGPVTLKELEELRVPTGFGTLVAHMELVDGLTLADVMDTKEVL